MIKVKYIWFFGCMLAILILLCGYHWVINPKLNELNEFEITKINLQQELAKQDTHILNFVHKPIAIFEKHSMQSMYLSDIAMLVHENRVSMPFFNFIFCSESYAITHLILQGNYQSLVSFVLSLSQFPYLIAMLDFIFVPLESHQYQLKLNLFLSKNIKNIGTKDKLNRFNFKNPFCSGVVIKPVHSINSIPLVNLKMIGYLKEVESARALIRLPSMFVVMVKLGEVIGKEKGIIVNLTPNYCEVKLSNGKHYFLCLRKNI